MMKKLLAVLLLLSVLILPVLADNQPKIALVLSGGIVTRGLSEIGVIKALEEENIPVSYVAGTSMGAVLGSLLAQGYSADEIAMIAKSIDWTEAFAQGQNYDNLLFGDKEKYGKYLLSLDLDGLKPVIPSSLVPPQKPSVLFTEISLKALSTRDFNKFKIPFRANATDIEKGEEVVFSSGYLPKVLRASSAVPVMMAPVEIDGKLLVDGGAVNNLPVNLVQEFDPDIIIAVNLGMGLRTKDEINSFFAVLSQSLALPQKNAVEKHSAMADVLIKPDISSYGFADFEKIDEIIEIGYKTAMVKMPEIKRLIAQKGKSIAKGKGADEKEEVLADVQTSGNTIYSKQSLMELISADENGKFSAAKVEGDRKAIWKKYFSDGYKLASVDYYYNPKTKQLVYNINEGKISQVLVSGREHISEVFLRSKIHTEALFNTENVMNNIDRLYATGFFESVDFSVVPEATGYTLEYMLKEKRKNSFSIGLRYDTYENLSLLTDLTIKYFRAQNFTQTLSLKIGNEFGAKLTSEFWPRRFGNNLVGEVTLFYEKYAQDVYNGSSVASSFYYLPKGIRLAAKANVYPIGQLSSGLELKHVSYENIFSFFPDESIAKWFVRSEIDRLDNPISPRSGFKAVGEYHQAAMIFGGNYDFSKAIAALSVYYPFLNEHVMFSKSHLQLGKGVFPISERYRVGGYKNLFGFGRTQYLGKDVLTQRFGYRLPIYDPGSGFLDGIYFSIIQDYAIVATGISEFNTSNLLSGFGLELQANTVMGLSSRLSLGMGQRAYLYFSIGNEF
ncbi:MAG: patatin-like phospholipase family protein [Candidatus Margulisiibacteriota bacterium]|nr:patatin-like phospholipase family protein [Candidatus Margulisiibacteriota bacterium]